MDGWRFEQGFHYQTPNEKVSSYTCNLNMTWQVLWSRWCRNIWCWLEPCWWECHRDRSWKLDIAIISVCGTFVTLTCNEWKWLYDNLHCPYQKKQIKKLCFQLHYGFKVGGNVSCSVLLYNHITNVHLFPWMCSTLFYFFLQFWGPGNLKLWFYKPPPHLALSDKHTHKHRAQRDTTGWWRTLLLQLEQTQFTQQDFLQILQLNFPLLRGEDAAPFPAQYPRANASISCLRLPIHYDYEYFKGNMEFAFYERLSRPKEPVVWINSNTLHLASHTSYSLFC